MKISQFGHRMTSGPGILSLMDDLGQAMAAGDKIMMGGGNPGHVPALQDLMASRLHRIADDPEQLRRLIGIYDPPSGESEFVKSLADLLRREYGWDVGREHICLTNGSQSGFFALFNLFGGQYADGTRKKIRLPMAPEYIGYADLGLTDDFFVATRPSIDLLADNLFKYRVDFDAMDIGEETGAICVSRPTNPTGNVITDHEVAELDRLARQHDVPLILDNAYGLPFPGIVYSDAQPFWNENTVVCLSLSKLGLPAARTGIVIARPEIIRALAAMNAVMNLAPGSFGAMLTMEMVASGEILDFGRKMIRPFYQSKAEKAVAGFQTALSGVPYRIHKPEGAMFLWLWFDDLPISSLELYERLKKRGVLVVSGHYFFPGLSGQWKHSVECLRVTYSQDDEQVARGITIIGDEVRKVYAV